MLSMDKKLKILKALSDETRFKIVNYLLKNGEKCVCEIVPHIKRAQPTVSLQLAKLESLGVLESRRDGKSVYYKVVNSKVKKILEIVNNRLEVAKGHTNEIRYKPIGLIHSQFKEPKGTPIQPASARGIKGTVEVFSEFTGGLKDLEGFSHIILVYHFHLSKKALLYVKPYMDSNIHGIFATRAPSRPNPIGISVVRLSKIEENILHLLDVDIVDGTPLLDIKPYVPEFDVRNVKRIGWLAENVQKLPASKDDGRFL